MRRVPATVKSTSPGCLLLAMPTRKRGVEGTIYIWKRRNVRARTGQSREREVPVRGTYMLNKFFVRASIVIDVIWCTGPSLSFSLWTSLILNGDVACSK